MKVIITTAEYQKHSVMPTLISDRNTMNLNGVSCIYGECTQADSYNILQLADSDTVLISDGVLLPKEVVEG